MTVSKVAIVQRAPTYLHRDETISTAVASIAEAAHGGARLVVFPEAFVPGYPARVWRLRPGIDGALSTRIHSLLLENAVSLKGGDVAPLTDAAHTHAVMVVCGIDERDDEFGGGTLYNTVLVIGPDGGILNRHRKLMPTNPERMVWGSGDGWIGALQHVAPEGCCWVVGSGCALRAGDFASDFPDRAMLYPDPEEWINAGDSVLVAPGGKIIAGPLRKEIGILYGELDTERVGVARRALDVVDHYARPDVFQLPVNTQPQGPVQFS